MQYHRQFVDQVVNFLKRLHYCTYIYFGLALSYNIFSYEP
jgi:hypothetical protein